MKHKILYLPSFVYAVSFASILLLYKIGWSDLYPELNGFLMYFLIGTIILSFVLSLIQKRIMQVKINDIELKSSFIKRSMYFIIIGYSLEFLYESSIPIVSTVLNPSYGYDDFNGIPTFHVILGTFNIFFSILMFTYYLTDKKRKKLFHFIITLVPYILILNRGAFMIVFSAMIFLFLMRMKSINLKTILLPIVTLLIVLYFFGVIGNIRQEQTKDDKEYLLRVAGATDSFINSDVPSEFYWSYIYLISPLGNLQNLTDEKEDEFNINNVGIFASTQLFPDFMSKRLVSIFGYDEISLRANFSYYFVTPLLNAPTVFFVAYFLLGSTGMLIMYVMMMLSAFIYPYLVKRNSNYYLAAIASLNSILLLSTFNNMWYATGTVLLWPIIFCQIERIKFR
ncbi:oligosaccharide repeat unit polymerase [Flavobacterium sp. MR2016-29]|uniref:O-antigen polymerase n=1 Tax=Flavobacterium sp. MR2016-29 TaxID=2783795 RepID=UPI00188B1971|nr:O-antigen polymerase [Flavobacterium sp. MR2016-29]MBF4492902.1 oligosaccharide repeat unit polymerase [Flavobacterium sp. MR2016-29]